ncbi:MAG: hypothetical protein ABIJ27_08690 [Candidatus Omnitrophota bacterium]
MKLLLKLNYYEWEGVKFIKKEIIGIPLIVVTTGLLLTGCGAQGALKDLKTDFIK